MTQQSDRRRFLQGSAALAAAGLLASRSRAQAAGVRVVVVTSPRAIDDQDRPDAAAVRAMVDRGVRELSGETDLTAAWGTFIKPDDKVALVDAGTWLLNVPEVLAAFAGGIALAKPARLDLTLCKYTLANGEYMERLRAQLDLAGVPQASIVDGVYDLPCTFDQRDDTVLAMAATVKGHPIAGVSGVVKHYATLTKGRIADYHPNGMETAGEVLAKEFGHLRHLTLVDALRWGDARKGPSYYARSLIFATDPVAADVVALKLYLENCTTLNDIPPELHRQLADTRYHAGVADLERIDIVSVEV